MPFCRPRASRSQPVVTATYCSPSTSKDVGTPMAPRLGRPVFAATNARAELGATCRARSFGLVDSGTTGLRVNRREHVVIGKRERVEEVESIAIQNPQIAVPTRVRGGLGKPSVDLGFDQERCRYFIPVPAVVRRVLMETFYPDRKSTRLNSSH